MLSSKSINVYKVTQFPSVVMNVTSVLIARLLEKLKTDLMTKNLKSDNDNYVDLAAERLAELFIEQAKYNRSSKKAKNPTLGQYIEQIKLQLRYFWEPVLVDDINE